MRHLPALGLMPGHGQHGWRKWAEFIALWLVCFAVTGGGAAWEAVRLADARGTVASGWAAGIAAGVGLGLALEALVAVPTTSGIGVAEIAYVCTFLAQFAVGVVAWLLVALRQRRPLVD